MQLKFATGVSAMRAWFSLSRSTLANHSDRLNAINVFPVPDGDTGTNLYLTLASMDGSERADGGDLGAVLGAAGRTMLDNARGNSGTLIAVFFTGFAEPLAGHERLTATLLERALERGRLRSYSALSDPVEGTMLTSMRAAAEAAENYLRSEGDDGSNRAVGESLGWVVTAVKDAVAGSEAELQVLADAGVVDAGAVGFLLVMDCLAASVTGSEVDESLLEHLDGYAIQDEAIHQHLPQDTGFEVMCSIELDPLGAASLRVELDALGDSVIMSTVGATDAGYRWRVHVHAPDSRPVLEALGRFGTANNVVVTALGDRTDGDGDTGHA